MTLQNNNNSTTGSDFTQKTQKQLQDSLYHRQNFNKFHQDSIDHYHDHQRKTLDEDNHDHDLISQGISSQSSSEALIPMKTVRYVNEPTIRGGEVEVIQNDRSEIELQGINSKEESEDQNHSRDELKKEEDNEEEEDDDIESNNSKNKKSSSLSRTKRKFNFKNLKEFLLKHWFLEGLVIGIGLAAAYPPLGKKGGILRTEYTVKYGVVGLIFVISGLSLKTKILAQAALGWKIHLIVQLLSLGLFPSIGFGVGKLLRLSEGFNKNLADGIMVACSTPTTISSNVLMTRQGGGNEAAALVNAVLGNILGVFISPSLIFGFLRSSSSSSKNESYGSFNYSQVFIDLSITVIAPLILGQVLQRIFPNLLTLISKNISLPIFNSCLLLILVWSVFCDTFASPTISSLNAGSLVGVIFLDLGLFMLFSGIAFLISRIIVFKFSKPDTVAIVMCAATKTVALGIPMINIIFSNSPSLAGIISIPLLIYHAEQLVVGSFFVAWFVKWTKRQ